MKTNHPCLNCGENMKIVSSIPIKRGRVQYNAVKYLCLVCDYEEVIHGSNGIDSQMLGETTRRNEKYEELQDWQPDLE